MSEENDRYLRVHLEVADFEEFAAKMARAEQIAHQVNQSINNLGNGSSFGKNFASQAELMNRSLNQPIQQLKILENNFKTVHGELSRPISSNNFFSGSAAQIELASKKLQDYESRLDRAQKKAASGFGSNVGQGVAQGLNIPLGTTSAVAVGVGFAVKGLSEATEAAFEQERAYRKLSSAATEAGLATSVLSDKNREFAKVAGLSETAAVSVEAKIAQLATYSGKPENIDKLNQSFLDLSAAKGINSKDINTLIGTILSGQDEGLNRLGISDPGQLYKAYAKEIGATGRELSQFEKVQAATNAVMDKAAIFAGANADRMNSLSGQSEQASANLENLYTNFGKGLTGSLEFRNALNLANGLLEAMTTNIATVQEKLAKGFSPKKLAQEEANRPVNQIKDAVADFVSPVGATIGLFLDSYKDTDEKSRNFFASLGGSRERRLQDNIKLFTAEANKIKTQGQDAAEQKGNLANKTFATSFQSQIEAYLKPASDGVEKTRITLGQLNKLQRDFKEHFKDFNESQRDLAEKGIQSAAKVFYTNETDTALKRFDRDPNLADARQNLKALEQTKKYLPEEKFEQYSDKLNDFIEKAADKVSKLKDDFRNALVAPLEKENPFVRLVSDFDTATDRARAKYKDFTDLFGSTAVADRFAEIERANLQKTINLQKFENNFDALKLRQDAVKTAALPERQFADFQRATERVQLRASNLIETANLERQIDVLSGRSIESQIARASGQREDRRYRESFEDAQTGLKSQLRDNSLRGLQNFEQLGSYGSESDLRRLLKDSSSEGFKKFLRGRQDFTELREDRFFKQQQDNEKISEALKQVEGLKNLSLEGTGIYGQGILAKEISGILNQVKDVRTDPESAAKIRNGLIGANRTLIDANKQSLVDKLEDQRFLEFSKPFAREQINLINQNKTLNDVEKAQRRLAVTNALGNDLDPALKRQQFQDSILNANAKEDQFKVAAKYAQDTRDFLETISKLLEKGTIKADIGESAVLNLTVGTGMSVESNPKLPQTPNPNDVAREMGLAGKVQWIDNTIRKRS